MPKHKTKRISGHLSKTRKGSLVYPKPRGKSLLILECDYKKLASQSLSMAEEIEVAVQFLASKVKVEIVRTSTENDLKKQFASLAENNFRFEIIVVISHSSTSGLRLTSDRKVSWGGLAKWIELFEPSYLTIVACQAGGMIPARDLFSGIPALKEIYASPLKISKPQSEIVKLLIPYLLNIRSPDSEIISIGQAVNFLLTGGSIFRWKRKEFRLPARSLSRKP